jgi:hypothetical protein
MSDYGMVMPTPRDIVAKIPGKANGGLRIGFVVLIVIGLAVFAMTVSSDPQRAWSALNHGLMFWMVLSQACLVVSGVMYLTKAKYSVGFQRMAVGAGSFLPWVYVVFVLALLLGNAWIFPWVKHPVPAKAAYLNLPFMLVRQIGLVGICTLLSMAYMRRVRRVDAGLAAPYVAEPLKARYAKWSTGWKGDQAEIASASVALPRYAGALIPVYAVTYTVVCWDWVMSQDTKFAGSMLGAWFFMGGILMAWAMTSVLSILSRRAYGLEQWQTRDNYHQIGKLIFAFSVFWTYLFWSMFLPIWYGNMPEETHWVVLRMRQPFLPWSVAAIGLTFFVPFSGFMNLAAKRNMVTHLFFALVILCGLWIERLMLIYPSIYQYRLPLGLPEIGVTLGLLGGFALCFQAFATTRPLIALDRLEDVVPEH